MKNFVSDNTTTVNLNDVLWMKSENNNTIVQFSNGSEPISYSNTLMWNKTVVQIKDNAQYFQDENTILNINYILEQITTMNSSATTLAPRLALTHTINLSNTSINNKYQVKLND